ncbi:hypothetical protein EES45_07365 [Streptomyces sp. ADI97-07]|uniref:hypothetical protein n=1 Tax=Streptomyces sp. ADI97-07 TaxID=1522762 RepID=UPI000F556219|nr:hypothetical protein [Streptomyces sp. ADI97-07]RPK83305.1 hypothetical protein EES45_07365 [Streptomyces sp. ADI97-07]
MSTVETTDDLPDIQVIDIRSGDRSTPFEHRVVPVSQTAKAIKALEKGQPGGQLTADAILRIAYSAVEPDLLADLRPELRRVETGWLTVINYRAYTLMLSPAVENDRLLDQVLYAADPNTAAQQRVLSMPAAHETKAALVYTEPMGALIEAVDLAARKVRMQNKQEVGRRIVERPLTAVPVAFLNPGRHPAEDLGLVDGNSRWGSCTALVPVPTDVIDAKDEERPSLLPSYLMSLPLADRRSFVREVIKKAYRDIKAAPGTSKAARAKRDKAARLLNAMTVPVEVVIGYTDDAPDMGMQRFPAAVRSLLMRMNIGVKEFAPASKNSVTAEETVTALFDEGQLGDNAQAIKDVLLGRVDMTDHMKTLGLSALRDLRFAFIAQQLTRREPRLNAIAAAKLDKRGFYVSGRSGLVVELGLRAYSAFLGESIKPVRTALEAGGGCLWQDLVNHEWTVENIDNDQAVDGLLRRTENGDIPAKLLLGMLAMVALVTSGSLLAAGGSAEQTVGHKVMRSGIGAVIKEVIGKEHGPKVLADAIKRVRRNEHPRWWADKDWVEHNDWKGSDFNAHLRYAALHGFNPEDEANGLSGTAREEKKLTDFQASLTTASNHLDDLIELRTENGTTDRLSWETVEASDKQLRRMSRILDRISEEELLG